jgi:hypothetical protein
MAMRLILRRIGVLLIAVLTWCAARPAAQLHASSLFAFTTNDFWLNLHHYLYVLGRAHGRMRDATQPGVAGAPDDERQGLLLLADEERNVWDAAVTAYANSLSRQSSVFQPPLAPITINLASTGDVIGFPVISFDSSARETLERAAAVYRKAWWPRHRAMNDQYVARLQQQIEGDGPAIVDALTRIYQLPWPEHPYPTHVVAYANWQGAFSFTGRLMVLSSNDHSLNDRWYPLEIVFHEAMHQWDDRVSQALQAQATRQDVTLAQDLSHALIFFTVGYVLQRLHSDHEPMIDAANLWRGTLSGGRVPVGRLRSALQETWKPYIDGRGTRDDAFAAMVAAAAVQR